MLLLSQAQDKKHLTKLFNQWPDGRRFEFDRVELMRLKEGRRALLQMQGNIISSTGEFEPIVLYGKIRFKGLDERTFLLNQSLFLNGFGSQPADRICVPEPIAMLPALNLCVYRKISGYPLMELLKGDLMRTYARLAVQAVYRLNHCGMNVTRTHTIHDELSILDERMNRMLHDCAHLTDRLLHLKYRYQSIFKRLTEVEFYPIHRDFYHDQVLIDGSRVYLLDLDTCAMGDPALDIGNFLAHQKEFGIRQPKGFDQYPTLEAVVIEECNRLWNMDLTQRIRTYICLSLIRLLCISTQMEERKRFTVNILKDCEEAVASL